MINLLVIFAILFVLFEQKEEGAIYMHSDFDVDFFFILIIDIWRFGYVFFFIELTEAIALWLVLHIGFWWR